MIEKIEVLEHYKFEDAYNVAMLFYFRRGSITFTTLWEDVESYLRARVNLLFLTHTSTQFIYDPKLIAYRFVAKVASKEDVTSLALCG